MYSVVGKHVTRLVHVMHQIPPQQLLKLLKNRIASISMFTCISSSSSKRERERGGGGGGGGTYSDCVTY